MTTQALALIQPGAALDAAYQPRTIEEAKDLAKSFQASGLMSKNIDSAAKAFTIMATGAEVGMGPMAALRSIYIVEGKPTLSADAMVAIVKRSGLCVVWQLVKSDIDGATYRTQRKGEQAVEMSFTQADAKRAGLWGKSGPWTQYPAKMLRHRAASDLAREVYPDLLAGLYDPDEVDAPQIAATVVEPLAPAAAQRSNGTARAAKPDPAPEIVVSSVDWPARFAAAADLAALDEVRRNFAALTDVGGELRAECLAAYKAQKSALTTPPHDAATGETREPGQEG